jgi:hypothetical protein
MAITPAAILSTCNVKPDRDETGLQAELVLVTVSGTYAQANGSKASAVDAAISAGRRNGKTVTIVDAVLWQPAFDGLNAGKLLGATTVAVSGSDVTFHVTEGAAGVLDLATEYPDATALPASMSPMGFLVTFTES